MAKYYLYDIQNDERVFKTDNTTYLALYGCIFNKDMLETTAGLVNDIRYPAIPNLYEKVMELEGPRERIYKIIEVEVD